MRETPECLNRRYKALDELIKELSTAGSTNEQPSENSQVGIKLMCDFWNILKDDPDCNLTEEVQQRMCLQIKESSGIFGPHRINCYATGKDLDKYDDRRRDITNKIRHITCPNEAREPTRKYGCSPKSVTAGNDKIPLSRVLCNLKEAASFDKKCNIRVSELIAAQKELTEQVQALEKREKDGVMLLKQADCMWSCMEEAYKKKLTESQDRQKDLLKELKDIEGSANKWRKNKKDLDFQMVNINKCHEDIIEKINQKKNDIKVMEMEIGDLTKRIESNVKDIDVARNSWKSKKEASDAKIANIAEEMGKVKNKVTAEQKFKTDKEQEGTKYVKDAREDLQKICRVLLQKKLENEDLRAEKEALLQEIELLKTTCDTCKEKCEHREKTIAEEIKKLECDLGVYRAKCIRCHECTDTVDVRKFCTDCPRCLAERDCLYEGDHCIPDHSMDCVCMSVKQKFLDNVFDNMYTVLERQIKTCPGKAVADCILNCLKRSRNGKLNQETRKVVQDFILSTVKKNLNLTIVGGAVKTRCEMDPETYKQLMLCLKDVNVTRPTKEDKGTASKKESCRRWGGTSECNCPKGPKACICLKKAPQPPKDPTSCGPPNPEETQNDTKTCPQRESLACGTDCGMVGLPIAEASGWRRETCQGQTCPFSNNMRAAQCVLGPEALASVPKSHPTPPIIPDSSMQKMATCTCGGKAIKPCSCRRDRRSQPRKRIIEEVMGKYCEVRPIDKVRRVPERKLTRRVDACCDCSNLPMKYLLASKNSENKICRFCACSSNYVSHDVRSPFLNKLRKKENIYICRSSKSDNDARVIENEIMQADFRHKAQQRNTVLKNLSDNDLKVILCPKFPRTCDDKIVISLGTGNMEGTESTQMRLKIESSSKINQGLNSCEASFVGRKVCETVKELMKDIVLPELPPKDDLSSSPIEWVTLESLFKEISSLTKIEGRSRDTVNEMEVKCETLEPSKDFKLLDKDLNKVNSNQNNVIGIQKNIIEQKQNSDITNKNVGLSGSTYNNEEHTNLVAEELKIKLLDDIRQTYNISAETSIDSAVVKEPEISVPKIKNIRKCLRNLGEVSIEQNGCNCIYTQHRKHDDLKSNLNKTKKYFRHEKSVDDLDHGNSSGINEVKKCLEAISNLQAENKVRVKKSNKIKKSDKKNK